MGKFSIDNCNREASVAVSHFLEDGKTTWDIPHVSEVKEYGRANNLNYSVPRFLGYNDYYFCTKYKKKKTEVWVTQMNPVILSTEGLVFVEEEQHGVEGIYLVPRHPRILVAYTEGGSFKPVQKELIGLAALQFQQAMHAANGLFISDFGLRVDDNSEYLEADDLGKAEIAEEYFKALKEDFDKELDNSPDTKEYLKATEFLADNISKDNVKEGVLPEWVQKELNKEADKVER